MHYLSLAVAGLATFFPIEVMIAYVVLRNEVAPFKLVSTIWI